MALAPEYWAHLPQQEFVDDELAPEEREICRGFLTPRRGHGGRIVWAVEELAGGQ